MKYYYDQKHPLLVLQLGQEAYIRLHYGYKLPGVPNRKLDQQHAGPFTVKRMVGPNAYELELLQTMKIHSVISVAQLRHVLLTQIPRNARPRIRPRLWKLKGIQTIGKVI